MMHNGHGVPAPFAEVLEHYRRRVNLTQEALAERAGLGVRTIQDLEGGVSRPRQVTLRQLSAALGLTGPDQALFTALATPRPRQGSAAPPAQPAGLAPSPDRPDQVAGPLLSPLTSLIGRGVELAMAGRLLRRDLPAGGSVRLLTLTGPGGIGKTRLALQIAADLHSEYPDGVVVVDLAPITDPRLALSALARVLHLSEEGGATLLDGVIGHLQPRRVLVLLDNFEQVIEAATMVVTILTACPHVTALVTSRAALHVRGEHELPVGPLALPAPAGSLAPEGLAQYPSVALFIERAQAVNPYFETDDETVQVVARICQRLDGLPLAIELAAARTTVLSPQSLLPRLERRLPLLVGGARDLPARQQTMRGAIDWSYNLLSAAEQTALARLSAFVGGWTLEAGEALLDMAGESAPSPTPTPSGLDLLDSLIAQNLIRREYPAGPIGGHHGTPPAAHSPRFTMLETIREYALERLVGSEDCAAVQARHYQWFRAFALTAAPHLTGPQQAAWLERLEADYDNLRAAVGWALGDERRGSDEADRGLQVVGALGRFWLQRGHLSEGRHWLERALANESGAPGVRAAACNAAGHLAWHQGDHHRAMALYQETLALRRLIGDEDGVLSALNNLGGVALDQGDWERGTALLEECMALAQESGNTRVMTAVTNNLGNVAMQTGDYSRAARLYEQSMTLEQELGNTRGVAAAVSNLGTVANRTGDDAAAQRYYRQALTLYHEIGDRRGIAATLEGLSGAAAGPPTGTPSIAPARAPGPALPTDPWRAACLLAAARQLREQIGAPVLPADRPQRDRDMAAARAALDDEAFAAASVRGAGLTLEQAIAYALAGAVPQP